MGIHRSSIREDARHDMQRDEMIRAHLLTSSLWKMPAASAADALVASNTAVKCDGWPAPLLAMTGMDTAEEMRETSSRSNPLPWPEWGEGKGGTGGAREGTLATCKGVGE